MNTLSLFNGMSVGKMALEALGITGAYYSSEVDKYATQASNALYPDTVQLGDVTKWREWDIDWSSIDLVTGGFPCQAWSVAGKQLGDRDERGMLFWVMLDIMKHVRHHNPKAHFMIENVKMKKEFEQYITTHTENALGHVHKILINSALISAQNRNRYYWTSFEVEQPDDKKSQIKDILESEVDIKFKLTDKMMNGFYNKTGDFGKRFKPLYEHTKKANTITARYFKMAITDNYLVLGNTTNNGYGVDTRKLTPRECMRLQTIPEHHIDTLLGAGISNTQLYKMTGNAWTMEVVKHILNSINKDNKQ
jgi:DNA (cytosine-5)-methyltransferase 1/DNA (cytosine-5)-methyltransferase 3A